MYRNSKPQGIFDCLQVVFEHDGVYIHTNPDRQDEQDSLISGCLRVIEKVRCGGMFLLLCEMPEHNLEEESEAKVQ